MTAPFSAPGRWVADTRGEGRGVRVSAHAEGGFLVVSTWKAGTCVATVRLLPEEAAELVAVLAQELAGLARTSLPVADETAPVVTKLSRGPSPAAGAAPDDGAVTPV